MPFDSIYVTFVNRQHSRNEDQIGGCQRLRKEWGWEGSRCDWV